MASKLTSLEIWYEKQFEKERTQKPNPPATEINPDEELKQIEQQKEWQRNLREQRLLEEEKRRIEHEKWIAKKKEWETVSAKKTQKPVEKVKIKALKNLKDLAANGGNDVVIQIAKIYEKNNLMNNEAFSWYFKAAELHDIHFMKKVARMFAYGVGTEQNDDKAIEYYKKVFPNTNDLECIKFFAHDVTFYSDFQKFHWYKKAADIGNEYFGIKVARMFAYGVGTEQNDDKAIEYFKKVFPNADDLKCIKFFAGKTKSKTKKLHWYRKAAKLGDKDSVLEVIRINKILAERIQKNSKKK